MHIKCRGRFLRRVHSWILPLRPPTRTAVCLTYFLLLLLLLLTSLAGKPLVLIRTIRASGMGSYSGCGRSRNHT
jgi:hypothetical protein